jgi:tRNA-specific 2-thiouridylase
MIGCDYIATGHYANIRFENGRYVLSRGRDANKDQTYVLWGLTQDVLARTIFPLSEYTKQEVREMAKKEGFDYLAKKSESYDICFIPDNDYRKFLNNRIPELPEKIGEGNCRKTQRISLLYYWTKKGIRSGTGASCLCQRNYS